MEIKPSQASEMITKFIKAKLVPIPSKPVPQPLYPTLGSTQEVIDLCNSRIPITSRNELYSLLMTFQNTLLKEVNQ